MKNAQAELKAIAAELQSITARQTSSRQATLLEPPQNSSPNSPDRNLKTPYPPDIRQEIRQQTQTQSDHSPIKTPPSQPLQSFPVSGRSSEVALPAHIAAVVEQLQQRSAPYLQQQNSRQPPLPSPIPPHSFQGEKNPFEDIVRHLEAQAERINQLAVLQETAMRELKLTAEQAYQTHRSHHQRRGTQAKQLPVCEYLEAVVPHVEKAKDGSLVLKTRSIDLHQAERDAELTAQALRQRTTRSNPPVSQASSQSFKSNPPVPQSWGVQVWRWLWGANRSSATSSSRRAPQKPLQSAAVSHSSSPVAPERKPRKFRKASRTRRSPAVANSASSSTFTLREGITLLLGSVLVRVLLDLVVAAYPMLWVPSLVVLVAPAAIAVYRTSSTPQAGFNWGYRLFSIMLGLLLGGRL